jgi:hypothetical protein
MAGKPTPLDVLLHLMHRKWEEGDFDAAVALAKLTAPYVHPRPVVSRAPRTALDTMPDDELDRLCGESGETDQAGNPE